MKIWNKKKSNIGEVSGVGNGTVTLHATAVYVAIGGLATEYTGSVHFGMYGRGEASNIEVKMPLEPKSYDFKNLDELRHFTAFLEAACTRIVQNQGTVPFNVSVTIDLGELELKIHDLKTLEGIIHNLGEANTVAVALEKRLAVLWEDE